MLQKISGKFEISQPLHSVWQTRQLEALAAARLPPHTLMQRAGLAVARLAVALAPHAQKIWIACGPGNNGGDGFEAALHLHQWGKPVVVTWTGLPPGKSLPADAAASRARAINAGVPMADQPPDGFDFGIDALLGIGADINPKREGNGLILQWLSMMHAGRAATLAIDSPTELNADTGRSSKLHAPESIAISACAVEAGGTFDQYYLPARHTLSLLTLKPGLFTGHGRDEAGDVWFDDLGLSAITCAEEIHEPIAWLAGRDINAAPVRTQLPHASHKGSFGDVAIVGGESTGSSHMAGAALLAASAALHAGAGRVFVSLLAAPDQQALTVDISQPELMFRDFDALELKQTVVVCGCGGGESVRSVLARLLSAAKQLVLDADALNAIASDAQLQTLLKCRNARGYDTVLTPHPLEAARLLGGSTGDIQADRLQAATRLAERFDATVVLKGSGTVIASPDETNVINSSGNALLATAGTGDVLAGMVGAYLAGGMPGFHAACAAVFAHGRVADGWAAAKPGQPLTASCVARQVLPAGL